MIVKTKVLLFEDDYLADKDRDPIMYWTDCTFDIREVVFFNIFNYKNKAHPKHTDILLKNGKCVIIDIPYKEFEKLMRDYVYKEDQTIIYNQKVKQ